MHRLPVLARGTIGWRVAAAVVVSWVVPMALALWAPAIPGELPFRDDLDAHVRALIALPLLIAVEPYVEGKLVGSVLAFLKRGIIPKSQRLRFLRIVAGAERMRTHWVAMVPLLLLAVALSVIQPTITRNSAWGRWYGLVSLSVFRFVLLRWYYWLSIWYATLWRISRLDLRLNPLHSDGCAGLGFLSASLRGLAPVLVAQAIVVAGGLAHRVQLGASPQTFSAEVAGVVFGLVAMAVLPLTFFCLHLGRARSKGAGQYGEMSMRYVDEFRSKWIYGNHSPTETLVGTPDLQSLADLHSGYDVVTSIKLLPASIGQMLRLAAFVLLPFVPLTLTTVPIDELAGRILKQLL